MSLNTGNFHVFFPKGCYRDRPTSRREEIFTALDKLIGETQFDLTQFDKVKQEFIDAMGTQSEDEAFATLNTLIEPLFTSMTILGFSEKELCNREGRV